MAIRVVDISKHNGAINWASLKNEGVVGVIIRAGYGLTKDPMWETNYSGAISNGLLVGAYWFAYPLSVAGAQNEADMMWGFVKGKNLKLGAWYDYEYDSSAYLKKNGITETRELVTSLIKAFCARMTTRGVNCGLYLNRDYIQNHLNYAELKQYPLWQAAWVTSGYTQFSSVSESKKPTTYGNIAAWQFGKSYIGGKAFDVNYYYGATGAEPTDYATLVCKKAGLEQQTRDFINTYKWAGFLWEKLWKAMS